LPFNALSDRAAVWTGSSAREAKILADYLAVSLKEVVQNGSI
jgi:hypothetical protein